MRTLKFLLLFSILILSIPFSKAQNPSIEWQKCMGGSEDDDAQSIVQTSDGGYIAVGHTSSTDFDAIANHSSSIDFFVVKFSSNGIVEWSKCMGGTEGEFYPSIKETLEGGYIISGSSISNDGDVSGNHDTNSSTNWTLDAWIVKLDHLGNIIWQKCYGGTESDFGKDIIQTPDGGYLFVGTTSSIDGDLQNLNFFPDNIGWIVKIDSIGNIEWQKLIGGTGYDDLLKVSLTSDNGYIIAGSSTSYDGDVQGNIWYETAWVIKLNSFGFIQWQKCIGNEMFSQAKDIKECSNGGYIVACEKSESYIGPPYKDGYIVKLSSLGSILWQKDLGGSRDEFLTSISETQDGGFIIGGTTLSWEGDIPLPGYGFEDCWIVKFSSIGNIEWQRRFGGNDSDLLYSLQQTSDLGYILAGKTQSNNHDVSGLHPSLTSYVYSDMWVVKLSPTVSTELFENVESIRTYPNPVQDYLNLQVDPSLLNHSYQIYSITGQLVLSGEVTSENMKLHLGSISDGIYLLKIGDQTKKIVKTK